MIRVLVHVERRHRLAERGPHAVVIDAGSHDEHEHLVAIEGPGRQHFDLHRLVGLALPFLADGPGIHACRHVSERRDFADLVKVLQGALVGRHRCQ